MINHDIIYTSLEHAAEVFGDITPKVYEHFLGKFPDAEQYFSLKGEQYKKELMNRMVEESLYAFLEYHETPREAEIVIRYTIPQHQDLDIPMAYFYELMASVAAVVCDAATEENQPLVMDNWQQLLKIFDDMIVKMSA